MLSYFLTLVGLTFSSALPNELALQQKLYSNYTKSVPCVNCPININLGISLRSLLDVSEITGTYDMNIWLRHWWKDERLSWNPDEYEISSTTLFSNPEFDNSAWVPDIKLINTAEKPLENLDTPDIIVYNTGDVIWSRPGTVKATCSYDLNSFPYDVQTCNLVFSSWSYSGLILNLSHKPVDSCFDLSDMKEHKSWTIKDVSCNTDAKIYNCCPEPYPFVTFTFEIERNSQFFESMLITPLMLTGFFYVISYFIPYDSGERISFVTTVFLAITVFLVYVYEIIPDSSENPLFAEILLSFVIFSFCNVTTTIFITKYYMVDDEKIKRTRSYIQALNKHFNITVSINVICAIISFIIFIIFSLFLNLIKHRK